MLKKFSKLSEKVININPYWEYKIDEYVLPNGKIENYYYAHTPGSTMIVPILGCDFVFTIQFRYLNQRKSLEFPGGGVKPNLNLLENAKSELLQETGYEALSLRKIGTFNPCNGLTDEICTVFLAEGLFQKTQEPDESEEIEVIILSEQEIVEKIKSGEIWDGMTLASWSLFKSLY